MAPVLDVLRTSRYCLLLVLALHVAASARGDVPNVCGAECSGGGCRYTVEVPRGSSWRLTPALGAAGDSCVEFSQEYDIRELAASGAPEGSSRIEVTVPAGSHPLYFCRYEETQRPLGGRWLHQGSEASLDASTERGISNEIPQKRTAPGADDAVQSALSPDLQGETQAVAEQHNLNLVETNTLDDKNNLIKKENAWVDLSHDTDVNNAPGAPRPAREEADDILILTDTLGHYVPLSEIDSEYRNAGDDASSSEETYGTDDGVVDQLDIKLPEVYSEVKQIRELGANDRESDDISQENTIVDLIETIDPDSGTAIKDPLVSREKRQAPVNEDTTDDPSTVTPLEVQFDNLTEASSANNSVHDRLNDVMTMSANSSIPTLKVEGLRIDRSNKEFEMEDGIPSVLSYDKITLRLFGTGLTNHTVLGFSNHPAEYGQPCKYRLDGDYPVTPGSVSPDGTTAEVEFTAPPPTASHDFYICAINGNPHLARDPDLDNKLFNHQGSKQWVILKTHNKPLPLWVMLLLILICLLFAALFSGLNLGLMALDRTELKIIANTGTATEKKYARAIQPVRDHGNYLLCSILLGNVAVNSTCAILCEDLMPGILAVIFSTLAIVCLGEIVPQAICSRHGLLIGAKSIVVTKAVMGITAPLAYPISKMLDYFLGEELGNVYNRERLKELVKVTTDLNDLDKDEVNIISGALDLRKKKVTEVMTRMEDVFMLSIDSVLGFETMSEIVKSGYSRIPVYEGERTNIIAVLFIKDLAFVDPDDNTPLRTLCQFYQNPCNFVFEDTTLDVMFRQFKEGHKGHMAFVQRVNNVGEGDPFYETTGLVTLEDVIEEMIQAEIVDETDVFTDNRSKLRRHRPAGKLQEFAAFAERHENQRIRVSPQLTLATFQFLSSTVDAFKADMVSETVLRRLLRQDIIQQIKCKGKEKDDPSTLVYTQGKPVDYFVLLLEGRVEVTVGRENLMFEAGPFTYFGVQALTQNVGVAEPPTPSAMGSLQNINRDAMLRYTFVPDYSVRAITELFYITIKRSLYLAAKRATLMEKTMVTKGGHNPGEHFDKEVDKLLESLDEEGSGGGDRVPSRVPSRQASPTLPPASASHQTRSAFASPGAPNNGDLLNKDEK